MKAKMRFAAILAEKSIKNPRDRVDSSASSSPKGMPVYTLPELAEKLKLSVRTLRQHIGTGELKARKVGRAYLVSERRMLEYIEGAGGPQ